GNGLWRETARKASDDVDGPPSIVCDAKVVALVFVQLQDAALSLGVLRKSQRLTQPDCLRSSASRFRQVQMTRTDRQNQRRVAVLVGQIIGCRHSFLSSRQPSPLLLSIIAFASSINIRVGFFFGLNSGLSKPVVKRVSECRFDSVRGCRAIHNSQFTTDLSYLGYKLWAKTQTLWQKVGPVQELATTVQEARNTKETANDLVLAALYSSARTSKSSRGKCCIVWPMATATLWLPGKTAQLLTVCRPTSFLAALYPAESRPHSLRLYQLTATSFLRLLSADSHLFLGSYQADSHPHSYRLFNQLTGRLHSSGS
uniref:RNA-directed DNA polymerase n=1 Tax=Macrostomum lignano TaxID=282301 RepID=A0A1I8F4M1_9PLAT